MTIKLKQSTASQEIPLGYFVDSTDGDTEETALTIANTDIKLWKMGATSLANKNSGGATHISNGVYYCVLDATDTNTLGGLIVFVHVSGALAVRVECEVLAANIYDSWIAGTDLLDVNTSQLGGTSQTGNDVGQDVNDILTDTGTTLPAQITTAQNDLDTLTGADGATLATSQPNYAPSYDSDMTDVLSQVNSMTFDSDNYIIADARKISTSTTAADNVEANIANLDLAISSLNNFDPTTDVVAHVTLVDTTTTNTDMVSEPPTAAANADAVWDETLSGHLGAGSTGEALNAAGAAGDPWTTSLPGAYGAGSAGYIVGNNLDEAISSKAYDSDIQDLLTGVTVATNNDKTGYALTAAYDSAKTASQDSDMTVVLSKTNLLTFDSDNYVYSHLMASDSDPRAEFALELLKYDFNGITGEASRSLLNAARFIRNKFSTTVTPGSVTIYKEDDSSVAYTKSITTDSDANPIVVG